MNLVLNNEYLEMIYKQLGIKNSTNRENGIYLVYILLISSLLPLILNNIVLFWIAKELESRVRIPFRTWMYASLFLCYVNLPSKESYQMSKRFQN